MPPPPGLTCHFYKDIFFLVKWPNNVRPHPQICVHKKPWPWGSEQWGSDGPTVSKMSKAWSMPQGIERGWVWVPEWTSITQLTKAEHIGVAKPRPAVGSCTWFLLRQQGVSLHMWVMETYHAGVDRCLLNVPCNARDKCIPVFEVRVKVSLSR